MKHTLYFDGNVQSIRYRQANGDVSVGVMAPGNYRFSSDLAETVAILEGTLMFSLDTDNSKRPIRKGESYNVPAGTTFTVSCDEYVSYICYFVEAAQ